MKAPLSALALLSACHVAGAPRAWETQAAPLQVLPEFEFSPAEGQPAYWPASSVGTAFDGTRFVVVWNDARSGNGALYGAHLDAGATTPAEPLGVPLPLTSAYSPGLGCSTQSCLLVGYGTTTLQAIRLDANLAALDATPIDVFATPGTFATPNVTSDGTDYVVGFLAGTTGMLQRVGGDGRLLGSPESLGTTPVAPALAFEGTDYAVAWLSATDGGTQVVARRLTPSGAWVDPAPNPLPVSTSLVNTGLSLTSDGVGALAAWENSLGISASRFYGGTWLDDAGVVLAPDVIGGQGPALAYDGVQYRAAWTQQMGFSLGVEGAQLFFDAGALVLSGPLVTGNFDGLSDPVAAAHQGTTAVVATTYSQQGEPSQMTANWLSSCCATPLGSATVPIPPVASNRQILPTAACGAEACLGVWLEQTTLGMTLQARLLSPDGGALGNASVVLTDGGLAGAFPVSVAAGATEFAVAWQSSSPTALMVSRVSTTGTVMDPSGIVVGQPFIPGYGPELAYVSGQYILAAEGYIFDGGTLLRGPMYVSVYSDGGVSGGEPFCRNCLANLDGFSPISLSVANGIVYGAWLGSWDGGIATLAARLDDAGVALDSEPIFVSPVSGGWPTVVAGAQGALVLLPTVSLEGVRLGADGGVLDATPLFLFDGGTPGVAALADETGYLVAYTDATLPNDFQLRGFRLWADGTRVGPDFDLVVGATNATSPTLTPSGEHFLLTYDRYDPTAPYQNLRARGRVLVELPLGTACGVNTDCASGYCVQGFCSATPPPDAGAVDAGSVDSGSADGGGPSPSEGHYQVGCASGSAGPVSLLLLFIVTRALPSRRRANPPRRGPSPRPPPRLPETRTAPVR